MLENIWPRITVVGAGAVGSYFGGMLARAGAPVTLIARARHVAALQENGLWIDSLNFQERVVVAASLDMTDVRHAEIVLFSVKTYDTEATARALAAHLQRHAIVITLQNGVDNVARLRASAQIEAVPAAVYVAAELIAPGRGKHNGRGDLILGDFTQPVGGNRGDGNNAKNLAEMFRRAEIPCRVSENIAVDLWFKMIMNCAYNAISALSRACYGRIATNPWTRSLIARIVAEACAIAHASGVDFSEREVLESAWQLAETIPHASSSMAQDVARRKPTEIDALNGYLARRGAELGIATPANQTLHALVKMLEEAQ